ncbi:glycoside hydrolase family 27 protein [Mycolicibacterium komossense]|uniref:Alpha-galactosidase n=2 Tax=Mycolicibacterium komossense TaxID=1779 RepID=A0ABT3CK96_9MYCO|nr:glycoside hydrolase family 27 protein [Mycolicibacterium komossense]
MGWNSWNSGMPLTEQNVKETIDSMVSSGMRDAGYRYVNLDAGWAAPTRDADGDLRADPDTFPDGIGEVARYAHDRGLSLGLYASPFNEICGQDPRIGSAGHESADARMFAKWGVDYLKYDWCRFDNDHDEQVKYFTAMRDALRGTDRRIIYSINPNSSAMPSAGSRYDWSGIADMTRNSIDLIPAWGDDTLWAQGLAGVSLEFAAAIPVAPRSRPGYWNDPDMMVVGIPWATFAAGHPSMLVSLALPGTVSASDISVQPVPAEVVAKVSDQRPDLTEVEQRTHFSLWAMLAAPLLAGNDLRTMAPEARAILTNRDVIAVDQDPLVLQGSPLHSDGHIIVKPLADGSVAVVLYNPVQPPLAIRTTANAVGLPAAACYTVRDLWTHTETTTTTGVFGQDSVPIHGVGMLRVRPGC